ncbi:hypothetical protein F2P81_015781 [Scophthalmus maximus]|uniref:Uncharacterized protein n=1 Tax=Scophthalmus maximus TaxID=52904 RepID=A0A6A4S7P3_SCOMX|nr:hypothetical protein F2P81_015781 [Scophthalmus maximus]
MEREASDLMGKKPVVPVQQHLMNQVPRPSAGSLAEAPESAPSTVRRIAILPPVSGSLRCADVLSGAIAPPTVYQPGANGDFSCVPR